MSVGLFIMRFIRIIKVGVVFLEFAREWTNGHKRKRINLQTPNVNYCWRTAPL